MWCPACKDDVVAELSVDNRRTLCAQCHSELGLAAGALVPAPRSHESERNARELLARWSTESLLEPRVSSIPSTPAPVVPLPTVVPSHPSTVALTAGGSPINTTPPSTRHDLRFDAEHEIPAPRGIGRPANPLPQEPTPSPALSSPNDQRSLAPESGKTSANDDRNRHRPSRRKQRPLPSTDQQQTPVSKESATASKPTLHPASVPFNQFTDDLIPSVEDIPRAKKTPWLVVVGQLCAYGGVALLTVGTVMVMSGHFGGPPGYAPTGWLVGAFGQMLLFLGVVTLVSGGLDQTVDEVTWRIDFLAERIAHLEQALADRDTERRRLRKRNAGTRKTDLHEKSAPNRADAA